MATKKHPDECQCCGQVIDAETIDKAMEANKVPSCTRIYDGEVCEGAKVAHDIVLVLSDSYTTYAPYTPR